MCRCTFGSPGIAPRTTSSRLGCVAAVAGAVPVVRLLEESLAATPIERIHGIVNGTTNFILTEMAAGSSYAEALAEAQRIGVISRLVPHEELRDAALQAVREILQTPPMARMHVKRMLNERYGLIDYQTMFWALAESPEPREGMLAFMEKRAPSWVPEEFA